MKKILILSILLIALGGCFHKSDNNAKQQEEAEQEGEAQQIRETPKGQAETEESSANAEFDADAALYIQALKSKNPSDCEKLKSEDFRALCFDALKK